ALMSLRCCVLWACLAAPTLQTAFGAAADVSFLRDVRPILSAHCFRCHGPDGEARQADLRLDTRAGLFAEASSGWPIVAPGDPSASELLRRVTAHDADERMPPAEAKASLSDGQVATLRRWIEAGAAWQDHWAYRPLTRPKLPQMTAEGVANPIDLFIL